MRPYLFPPNIRRQLYFSQSLPQATDMVHIPTMMTKEPAEVTGRWCFPRSAPPQPPPARSSPGRSQSVSSSWQPEAATIVQRPKRRGVAALSVAPCCSPAQPRGIAGLGPPCSMGAHPSLAWKGRSFIGVDFGVDLWTIDIDPATGYGTVRYCIFGQIKPQNWPIYKSF